MLLNTAIGLIQAQTSGNDFSFSYSSYMSYMSKRVDSLRLLLVQEKTDTGQVTKLNALASAYLEMENDSSLWYAERALQQAQRIRDTKGEIRARLTITNAHSLKGEYFKALQTAFLNLELAQKAKDTSNILSTLREICRTYTRMNDDSSSLVYARQMKPVVYSGFFKKGAALKWAEAVYANWMGTALSGLNKPDSALYYLRLSYRTALFLNTVDMLAVTANNLSSFYAKTGQDDSAASFFRLTIDNAVKARRPIFVANACLGLGKLFAKKGQYDSALYYGQLSLKVYQQMKSPKGEMDAASLLSETYGQKQRTDSAYHYLTLAVALKDSVFNQDKERQVQNLQFNELLRRQQLERERKETQQRYATRLKIYSLLGGLAILAILAFLLYHNNAQKQKANALLQQKNEQIEKTLHELKATQAQLIQSEKMASLGELTA
ncbi:MAG: hypothetical protein ICV80_21245, partial [Microcoleus sp. T1-bin1]|nr:hypothetical protein [Microcoleus sp. T1-bin1]